MKRKLEEIPLWFINLITLISGIIAIVTPFVTLICGVLGKISIDFGMGIAIFVLFLFNVIQFFRVRKYRGFSVKQLRVLSMSYHNMLHKARDLYFYIMHEHKKNCLTINSLSHQYKGDLEAILDNLCNIMKAYTAREVSACIKLIAYPEKEEIIDQNNARLITFCRSSNSDNTRQTYESKREILLRDNTDFLEILSDENGKNYFYCGDLKEYEKSLKKLHRTYKNSNEFWYDYYKGTIVVPIRVEFKLLYHQKKDDAYHIIGFLCVDSLSTDAFTQKQEKYNVEVVKSFADIIYVLLGQYRHYLSKLKNEQS